MRAVHSIDLEALSRVFGSGDESLVEKVLGASDVFTQERLQGSVACGFEPAAMLRAIVAGDVKGIDRSGVLQMFDIIVHRLGTEIAFMDEAWAPDRVLTAIDKAKVAVDRGSDAPLPWPIERSETGLPMIQIWSTPDLATLAGEIEGARGKVPADLGDPVAAVARAVSELVATGKQVVVVDWL